MLTTPQLRKAWAHACAIPLVDVEIVQGVQVKCHERAVTATRALGLVMQTHKYAVRQSDTGGFNCRPITGGREYSLHAYGIALDINWDTNPYRSDNRLVTDMPRIMVGNILRIKTINGRQVWGWGGNYPTIKDSMHFEIVCTPDDLATGIDWSTVQQPTLRVSEPYRWPLIKRGDRGPAVEQLQRILAVTAPGEPGFGIFGPRTEAIVRAYQQEHGLTVDGIVGRQTWTALLTAQPSVGTDEPGPVKRQPGG